MSALGVSAGSVQNLEIEAAHPEPLGADEAPGRAGDPQVTGRARAHGYKDDEAGSPPVAGALVFDMLVGDTLATRT